jgi:hypothetical protein
MVDVRNNGQRPDVRERGRAVVVEDRRRGLYLGGPADARRKGPAGSERRQKARRATSSCCCCSQRSSGGGRPEHRPAAKLRARRSRPGARGRAEEALHGVRLLFGGGVLLEDFYKKARAKARARARARVQLPMRRGRVRVGTARGRGRWRNVKARRRSRFRPRARRSALCSVWPDDRHGTRPLSSASAAQRD